MPQNEVDQMLTYKPDNLIGSDKVCPENQLDWPEDPDLPITLNSWLTDLIGFVNDPVDAANPTTSSLGSDKLFLMSYTDARNPSNAPSNYFLPFTNDKVDIIDAHIGLAGNNALANSFDTGKNYRDAYTSNGVKKPFQHGEHTYYAPRTDPATGNTYESGEMFHNYDISYHNELWAGAFMGNFTTGTSWLWQRVFWWPDALAAPIDDISNSYQTVFYNTIGTSNLLDIGPQYQAIPIENRATFHHIKPLTDMLANSDWQGYNFFNSEYTAHKIYDPANDIQCFYLMSVYNDIAIGWVHNESAYWENNYYFSSSDQNFLGCSSPTVQQVSIPGFLAGTEYHVTYFPTHMNTTVKPSDQTEITGTTGTVNLDLSTAPLNGTANNFLDTLHSDYAFIISLSPIVRSLDAGQEEFFDDWGFTAYPNPTRNNVQIMIDTEKWLENEEVSLLVFNNYGQLVHEQQISSIQFTLNTTGWGSGMYALRLTINSESKLQTLIIN